MCGSTQKNCKQSNSHFLSKTFRYKQHSTAQHSNLHFHVRPIKKTENSYNFPVISSFLPVVLHWRSCYFHYSFIESALLGFHLSICMTLHQLECIRQSVPQSLVLLLQLLLLSSILRLLLLLSLLLRLLKISQLEVFSLLPLAANI